MIANIRLQKFRSYADQSFEFDGGVNIIVGPNASGKTNLLEAILVLCRGNSYRAKDTELVQFDQPWSRLDAYTDAGVERTVKLVCDPIFAKTYELEGKTFKRLTLQNTLPVVLFEPNHLQLLHGSPEQRRTFLDDLLEQTKLGYGTLRRQYKRTLAQRNALLKKDGASQTELFPWDVRLSQLAGQIVRARSELTAVIWGRLPSLYQELANAKTKVSVRYAAAWPVDSYETNLLKKLESSAELDRLRGFTAHGPHREDMEVMFDGHAAQDAASRGEARTLVLGLKVIELEAIAAARDTMPLLLLDDVFSELDGSRRRALTEHLAAYQTFITTTDADLVLQHFTEACRIIPIGS